MESVDFEKILRPVDKKELFQPLRYYKNLISEEKLASISCAEAFSHWLSLPEDRFQEIKDYADDQAVSVLIWDDILLEQNKRFVKPSANSVYGLPLALNSFLHASYSNLTVLTDLKDIKMVREIFKNLKDELMMKMMYSYWSTRLMCPTIEDYLNFLEQRGCAVQILFKIMQQYSADKTDHSNIIKTLGVFFEMRNDYRSILCQEQDVRELDYIVKRKIVFPVVHAVNTCPHEKEALLNLLTKKTDAPELQKLLEKCGSVQYTRDKLVELREKLLEKIDAVGGNPVLVKLLDFE